MLSHRKGPHSLQNRRGFFAGFVELVILCFDSDQAGQDAIGSSLPALLECGLDVRVASLPEGEDPDSLIRKGGVTGFRKVVANARNFFDHALQRLTQDGSLDDPAGKLSAARQLGPLVAMIKDHVLRYATAKKIWGRLGISETAFATHLSPAIRVTANQLVESPETMPLSLSEPLRILCRMGLMHAESRAWLKSQPQPPYLGEGGELLNKILNSSLSLEEPSARAAFISNLSSQEEMTVAQLDLMQIPDDPLQLAKNAWRGLRAQPLQERSNSANPLFADRKPLGRQRDAIQLQVVKQKLEAAKSRLSDTTLETSDRRGLEEVVANLTKQILGPAKGIVRVLAALLEAHLLR